MDTIFLLDPSHDLQPAASALAEAGYRVESHSSPAETAALCQTSPPALIFSTIPDELLLRELRTNPSLRHTAFLLLTDNPDPAQIDSWTAAGVQDILPQSLSPAEWRAHVHTLLRQRETIRNLKRQLHLSIPATKAAQVLLTEEDLDHALNHALRIIGEATHRDRAYIFELHTDPRSGDSRMSQRYEWVREGISPELHNPSMQNIHFARQFPGWFERLSADEIIHGPTHSFPTQIQRILEPQHIKSILVAPILTSHGLWGFIGFDNCRDAADWLSEEQDILRSTASAIGAALQRERLANHFFRSQRMESLGTLAGGIAHDLNNVLSPLMISTDMLKLEETDPEKLKTLGVMEVSIRRGADLVRQVLSFARGREGKRVEVQMRHILRDLHRILLETFPKSITVRMNLPSDLPAVRGEPALLHQVLLNLCVNARDAMPQGGTLHIHAEAMDSSASLRSHLPNSLNGKRLLHIQITDDGPGIPDNLREKIFDPFFTTKPPGNGTGLGLSTSLKIMHEHGGDILLAPRKPQQGACFHLLLPAVAPRPFAPERPQRDVAPGKGQLVLVVEDENQLRSIVQRSLERNGYRVLTAANGAEAVESFRSQSQQINVVVTDLMMPVMDGITAMRHMREINPRVPLIATSGFGSGAVEADNPLDYAVHFLRKPYSARKLLEIIGSTLAEAQPPSPASNPTPTETTPPTTE